MNKEQYIKEVAKISGIDEDFIRAHMPPEQCDLQEVFDFYKTYVHQPLTKVEHTEQKVLLIPKADLNLDEGWQLVSSQVATSGLAVKVTVRKTHLSTADYQAEARKTLEAMTKR